MSTWEQRMAAKAAARQAERDGIARAAEELQRAEEERREAEWRASLPPCPCQLDPCPEPPTWSWHPWWQQHREEWERFNRTGRCEYCGRLMPRAEYADHDCPDAPVIVLAL
jgi:hypothetical protein